MAGIWDGGGLTCVHVAAMVAPVAAPASAPAAHVAAPAPAAHVGRWRNVVVHGTPHPKTRVVLLQREARVGRGSLRVMETGNGWAGLGGLKGRRAVERLGWVESLEVMGLWKGVGWGVLQGPINREWAAFSREGP